MAETRRFCPRCARPLEVTFGRCLSWVPVDTGKTVLVLEQEALFRCTACAQLYFAEELVPGIRPMLWKAIGPSSPAIVSKR